MENMLNSLLSFVIVPPQFIISRYLLHPTVFTISHNSNCSTLRLRPNLAFRGRPSVKGVKDSPEAEGQRKFTVNEETRTASKNLIKQRLPLFVAINLHCYILCSSGTTAFRTRPVFEVSNGSADPHQVDPTDPVRCHWPIGHWHCGISGGNGSVGQPL